MKIAFLGAGKMATALAGGLSDDAALIAYDVSPSQLAAFRDQTGGEAATSIGEAAAHADAVVIAVKPQVIGAVLPELDAAPGEALVVSIAAGVTLATLEGALPKRRVVRVMPNTPSLVGCGAAAYARGHRATDADAELCRRLLESVGCVCEVAEPLLDAVTGLSGSGPAYGFVLIEALADAGVREGLPRELATMLAAQTMKGAAEMVLQTGTHPAALKDAVASPGGTTIAGLAALESHGGRAAVQAAVAAASQRSRELG